MSDTPNFILSAETGRAQVLRHWLALAVTLAGTFMVTLDFFIVNVAIPAIQRDLQATSTAVEWIVAAYGLSYAALLVIGGRLGDVYGRRRIFCFGLALFTTASAACGLAPSPLLLILGRLAQGVGAAVLAPQVLAMLGTAYQGDERQRAFAAFGLVLGVASALGQLVGGLLIQADILHLEWRSCFLVNLPIGGAALLLAPGILPESRAAVRSRMDLPGAGLVALSITALLLPLIEGRAQNWPAWSWFSLASAGVLLAAFAGQQLRRTRRGLPCLVDPGLWRVSRFRLGLLGVLALYSGVASFFLVLALYLQVGRGLDALVSGGVASTMAMGFCITSLGAARIARWMERPTLVTGASGMAAALGGLWVLVGQIGADGPVGTAAAAVR